MVFQSKEKSKKDGLDFLAVRKLGHEQNMEVQGTKLTFLARSHLAPKFSKVVAMVKKLGAVKIIQ